MPSMRPVRWNSCWAPPAAAAFLRRGLANRRCLAALPVLAFRLGAFFLVTFGAALAAVERFGARVAGAFVSDAGPVGAASGLGSLSSCWISRLETFCGFGDG